MRTDAEDFGVALRDLCSAWPALMPPTRRTPSQSAAEFLMIKRPGGGSGLWKPHETPYMVEPLDVVANRRFAAFVFVGPAQSGKTVALGEAWMTHAVISDPGDMLIVQMTQDLARIYSKQRIDRAIKNSPALRALQSHSPRDDNLHDKAFRNGMMVRLAWPTITNLSSSSYRYGFGTDYDRWPDNIDGEGDGWTLLGKRVTTFGTRGKYGVESSPGKPIKDPLWTPATPHEAPPVGGVLGIYNRSDRRRYYWACPHCRERFEAKPGLELFRLPSDDELLEDIRFLDIDRFAQQHARIACPVCAAHITFEHRDVMNLAGRWLADGLVMDAQGRISGTPRTSSIAGFWLGGAAATYVTWETLIRKHLQALLQFEMTGSELELQTTANTDQCVPYASRLLLDQARGARTERQRPNLPRYVVPDWTRLLVASVDVQGGRNARFEVQVHAVGEHKEQQLIDRYPILWSKRQGIGDEFAPIDPAAYAEDWDVLTEKVVQATYRTSDANRELRIKRICVDSGGEDGVTDRAYAWYRRLRQAGLHHRVRVTKGANTKVDWHVRETMVGGQQGRGDIPLLLFDPNKFKDMLFHGLARVAPGPNYYHLPEPKTPRNPDGWLSPSFYDELQAEVRNASGGYDQIKRRNESIDLCVGVLVGCMDLGLDRKGFWDDPPDWALPLDRNSEVVTPEQRREEKSAPVVLERRIRHSSYISG